MATRGDKIKIVHQFPEPENDVKKVNASPILVLALGDSFRARQLSEVLRILKRPAVLESEGYEGD